jgi:hypothetical protein
MAKGRFPEDAAAVNKGRTMMGNLLFWLTWAERGEVGVVSSLRKPKGVDKVALAWHS